MSPAKKQTTTTEPKETPVTDETTTPETVNTDGPIIIPEDQFERPTEEQTESPELTSFRAAAEFFKALDFEYEDTFDVHVDKSGIRAFVRHPQNGMRTAKFISFQEIPLVQRQAIVDEVSPKSEDEGE